MNKQTVYIKTSEETTICLAKKKWTDGIWDWEFTSQLEEKSVYVLTDEELDGIKEKHSIEFARWMNAPMNRADGDLLHQLRCIAQFPDYKEYVLIGHNGNSIGGRNRFYTIEELYQIFLTNK